MPTLATHSLSLYDQFLHHVEQGRQLDQHVSEWERLKASISALSRSGALSDTDKYMSAVVAGNVRVIAQNIAALQADTDDVLQRLDKDIELLLISETPQASAHMRKRHWPPSPSPSNPSLSPSPTSTPLSSAPSSPTAPTSSLPITREPSDHIRGWFLSNLAHPFPTFDEKINLSRLTGIARHKIDSDLTNWRRRTGWTEVRNKYGNGDKERTREVIEKVERGEEGSEDIVEAVEKMKSYLKKEKEFSAGSWIKKLKPAVNDRKGKKRLRTSKATERPPTPPPSTDVSPDTSFSTDSSILLLYATPPASLRSTSGSSSASSSANSTFSFKPYSYQVPTPSTPSTSPVGSKRSNDSLLSQDEKPSVKPRLDTFTGTYEDPEWVIPVHHTSPDQYMLLPDPSYATTQRGVGDVVYAEAVWWDSESAMPPMLDHMVEVPVGLREPFVLPEQHAFNFTMSDIRREV